MYSPYQNAIMATTTNLLTPIPLLIPRSHNNQFVQAFFYPPKSQQLCTLQKTFLQPNDEEGRRIVWDSKICMASPTAELQKLLVFANASSERSQPNIAFW